MELACEGLSLRRASVLLPDADLISARGAHKKAVLSTAFLLLLTAHPVQTANSRSGEFGRSAWVQAAWVARVFTLVDRRLLSRAALFLWKMPLSATVSTTACILPKASVALVLSPASTAFSTFLTAVRYCERSEVLAALILMS